MTQQYIHPESRTIYRDLDDAYTRGYRVLSGGKAEPRSVELLATVGIMPYKEPVILVGYKRADIPTDQGDGYWSFDGVPKTAEELAADRAGQIQQIGYAGKAYLDAQIDPDGLILVDRLYRAGHPYGVANNDWGVAIRVEQYRRMALVESGAEDFAEWMLDFSEYGQKPYTVPQMLAAAMGA